MIIEKGISNASVKTVSRAQRIIIDFLLSVKLPANNIIYNINPDNYYIVIPGEIDISKRYESIEIGEIVSLKSNDDEIYQEIVGFIRKITEADIHRKGEQISNLKYWYNIFDILQKQGLECILKFLLYIKKSLIKLPLFSLLNLWRVTIDTIINDFITAAFLKECGFDEDSTFAFVSQNMSLEERLVTVYHKLLNNKKSQGMDLVVESVYPKLEILNNNIKQYKPNDYNICTKFLEFVSQFRTVILYYYLYLFNSSKKQSVDPFSNVTELEEDIIYSLLLRKKSLKGMENEYINELLKHTEIEFIDISSIPKTYRNLYDKICSHIKLMKNALNGPASEQSTFHYEIKPINGITGFTTSTRV